MKEVINRTFTNWKNANANHLFRWQFLSSIVFFIFCSQFNFYCLNVWEARTGQHLNDILINMLPSYDFSNIIFFFTYFCVATTIITALPYPGTFVRGLQAYSLLLLARVVSIYFFPLEPPVGMIQLVDPVGEFFLHQEVTVTKDLFFSGHTATITFMFLLAQNRYVKSFCGVALCIVPLLLVWQHVHYTIDILVAPFVAYGCKELIEWVHKKNEYSKVLYDY